MADDLGIQMRRVSESGSAHFAAGEAVLSEWVEEHARVCWAVTDEPWAVEPAVIASLDLPLNLEHNLTHPFAAELQQRRAEQRAQAQ